MAESIVIGGVPVMYRKSRWLGEYDVVADASSIGLGLHMLGRICRTADRGWKIHGAPYNSVRFVSRRAAATVLVSTWSLRERVAGGDA